MQKRLLICSKSTEKYFSNSNKMIFTGVIDKEKLKLISSHKDIIVCGGGACIDFAKIVSSSSITCYPTTAAGSCKTSHSEIGRAHV